MSSINTKPLDRISKLLPMYDQKKMALLNSNLEIKSVIEMLNESNYLFRTAELNPDSLCEAILIAGQSGLSFCEGDAILVSRGERVVLDVSFHGLKSAAELLGAVDVVSAHVVRKNDKFKAKGHHLMPEHLFDAMAEDFDRGEIVGAYCVAQKNSHTMVTFLTIEQIERCRVRSSIAKDSSWLNSYDVMSLKTVIKTAANNWPRSTIEPFKQLVSYIENIAGEGAIARQLTYEKYSVVIDDEPLTEAEINELRANSDFIDMLSKVIKRAGDINAWQAAKDYVAGRVTHPKALKFGMQAIEQASQHFAALRNNTPPSLGGAS